MTLKIIVGQLVLLGLASHAVAQTTADQRITITGSSIKRIAAEGALPVQVITRAELDREGITSAEQLILQLSTNGNGLDNLSSNSDVVGGAQRGNNGASSANLRGQGSNATLILLNGRRIAAHGLNGGTVDLNQIPMSAVQRIEVLKDGASSTYGTDAVGGVINFILRTDFTGLTVQAVADIPQKSGGEIYRASVLGGLGNLEADGFNLMASLSYSDNKALRGDQRGFVNTFQPNRGLSVDTRGTPFATIFPLAGTVFPNAASTPLNPNGTAAAPNYSGGINVLDLPGGLGCGAITGQAPYDNLLWDSPAATLACAWDTGRAAVLQQPIDTLTFVARGAFKLGGGHLITAEATGSKADSAKRFSNLQLTPNTTTQQLRFPRNTDSVAAYDAVFNRLVAAFPAVAPQRGQPLAYRWRCIECGPREITTTTETQRLFAGIEGPLFGFDYRAGISQASSDSKSTLGGGYYFRGTTATGASDGGPGIIPALNTGKVNVFLLPGQTQSAAGLAELEAGSARGTVLYGGEFTMTQVDFTVSGPVFKLPAGDVLAAVGVDIRTEKYKFNGDERAATARRVIIAAPFDDGNALLGVKRDVKAVFAEVIVPITKSLETTLSARQDDYDGFGSTTNPKISARWKAFDTLLLRASYSTGFRVPTFNQLYNGSSEAEYTGADLADPRVCPGGRVDTTRPGCAAIRPIIINGGKPDLGPEEAKLASVGFIFEPIPNLSIGMDWWSIKREGTIQLLALRTLLENVSLFPERFGVDNTGRLVIDQRWLNAGETETEGAEVSLKGAFDAMGSRWTAGLEGTYLIKKRSRVLASAPFGASEVGQFSFAGDLGLRWKHTANLSHKRGDWSSTFSQIYKSGYNDQVLPGVASGRISPPDFNAKVKDYTIYNLSATYSGIKNLSVTGLVKNLFDKDPPFAATYDSNFGSGSSWETRVADPRGRAFVVNVEYKFF